MQKSSLLIFLVAVQLIHTSQGSPFAFNKKDVVLARGKSAKEESSSSVTEEEKKFVRDIEAKFNIKSDHDETDDDDIKIANKKAIQKPLPAVIAIEIVNDNSTDGKGKRTIDANLGYGYKTDTGYFYRHFGKPFEEKGKFMIYPYSQHDIPPNPSLNKQYKYHTQVSFNRPKSERTHVEILPSKAYQLVPVQHNELHDDTYKLDGTFSHLRTKYEHIQAVQTPPPPQYHHHHHQQIPTTTLYSTFNGGQLSGLSGQFPLVMPHYYISPSQFLNQYQDFGGAHEHLPQKSIIPVLILRIPSSQLKNPTAEFYPKLPHNNPYASSLNGINLQALVQQYLENVPPKYEAPAPVQHKYVVQYEQPQYYQQPQAYYTVQAPVQYQANPHYEEQQQYVQEGAEENNQYVVGGEEHKQIQYVIPHSESNPHALSHMTYSRVYGPPKIQYAREEETRLPFSENYPDEHHTKVIYTPQYQIQKQLVQPEPTHVEYVSAAPVEEEPYKTVVDPQHAVKYVNPQAVSLQTSVDHYEDKVEQHDENAEVSPSVVPPEMPYNYHAHPFPKRQVKQDENASMKTNNRKHRSGV